MSSSLREEVIWERENKAKKWCSYSTEVSQLIEQAYEKNLTSVWLGDADSNLKVYTVNLKDFIQTSETTGTKCRIRRRIIRGKPNIFNQAMWEWCGDSKRSWHCYSPEISAVLENAFLVGDRTIDLSSRFPGYRYTVDFTKMVQINNHTKYLRSIRRTNDSSLQFPSSNYGVDGAACASADANSVASDEPVNGKTSKKKKNRSLGKKVNKMWKKMSIGKTNDSSNEDDDFDGDICDESINKKLCSSTDGSSLANEGAESSVDGGCSSALCHSDLNPANENNEQVTGSGFVYALVHGKPWKHPWPPHTPHSQMKPVPGIDPLPNAEKKSRKKKAAKGGGVRKEQEVEVFNDYTEEMTELPAANGGEEQVCTICYENLQAGSSFDGDHTVLRLKLCSHCFHKSCLKAMYESGNKNGHLQCPTCKTIHGVKRGIQPPGTMLYHVLPYSLPGYPERDTIQIIYDIRPGVQGPEHPHPGMRYSARGFPRHCYLPDNEIGRKVLRLLIEAWERRLIFTVGISSTTGETDTVTWNEIHHKTEFGFNRRGHGYPDPSYFDNVIAELAAHGVTDSTPTRCAT